MFSAPKAIQDRIKPGSNNPQLLDYSSLSMFFSIFLRSDCEGRCSNVWFPFWPYAENYCEVFVSKHHYLKLFAGSSKTQRHLPLQVSPTLSHFRPLFLSPAKPAKKKFEATKATQIFSHRKINTLNFIVPISVTLLSSKTEKASLTSGKPLWPRTLPLLLNCFSLSPFLALSWTY